MLDDYAQKIFEPLQQQIEAQNFAEFDTLYRRGIDYANQLHVASHHGEIVWKLPAQPPQHLELGPQK